MVVKFGEKVNMLVEMIPVMELETGRIIDWQIVRSFRINPPRNKQQTQPQKDEELISKKHEKRLL